MKRAILTIAGIFLLSSIALPQVIADFESDLSGYQNNGWGTALTNVVQAADPTGKSTGVGELTFTFTAGDKGAMGVASALTIPLGTQYITYWVYLPSDIPDGIGIGVYAQDNKNWTWNETITNSQDIPKETWFPLSFDLGGAYLKNNSFDIVTGKLHTGLQIQNYSQSPVVPWTGKILVDNVSLIGVEPTAIADFESTLNDYQNNNWGAGLTNVVQAADPTGISAGVAELTFNFTTGDKGAFGAANALTVPLEANFITYWVYLSADTPDSLAFGVYAQDNKNWSWNEKTTFAKDIPKTVWFPLSFDLRSAYLKNNSFDIVTGKLHTGLQIHSYNLGGVAWSGKVLVDNISFLSKETGVKWVVCNFNNEAAGTQGFVIPSWATGLTAIQWTADAEMGGGILSGTVDYSKGSKVAFQKDGIEVYDADNAKFIDGITVDVFIPADLPAGGAIEIVYQPAGNGWPWLANSYAITDSGVVRPGKWSTLNWDVAANIDTLDPTIAGNVFVQLNYGTVPTWTGSIAIDNLTLLGIEAPAGTNLPVALTAVADTSHLYQTGKIVDYVRFDWVDNTIETETYNLYMSESPIIDLNTDGVVKFAHGIPHGLQKYAQRPYSNDGGVKNYYYAATSVADGIETVIEDKSKAGPIAVQTTPTFKVKYVQDFASKFQLDGLDNEFTDYKTGLIVPESAGSPRATAAWTPESPDLSFKITLVIDDKYLYISADINDDEVINDGSYQAWQGDAIEFFLGFYDVRTLKEWHGKNFQHANGDWRFAFTSRGTTALDGGTDASIPGCEATTYVKFTGDGYICEARVELDSLAKDKKFGAVTNGMLLPFRIDCNDVDLLKGDTNRGLQCGIGGVPTGGKVDLDQDWTRPHGWGFMEVIDAPTAVETNVNRLPKIYQLYNNYPNPFNPTTTIKYDLPKESFVTLKVYDITGKEVMTLVNNQQKAGFYELPFNASKLASGIYMYRIIAGNYVKTNKMVLIK